jgi:hypothetical protein
MRALALAGCGVMGATFSGCESTEQESAKLSREGARVASAAATLQLGAPNNAARVSDVTLLSGEGRTAVALRVTATTARAQANVPVLVKVADPHGKVLYSNDAGGIEPSLQRVGLIPPHAGVWWVDDQVLSSQTGASVSARVGTGASASPRAVPPLSLSGVRQTQSAGQNVVAGNLRNGSARTLERVPVFAVALRGGRPVAAGRAVVESLPAHVTASFQIFMVGNPAGGQLAVNALSVGG